MVRKHIHPLFPVIISIASLQKNYHYYHLSFLIGLQKKKETAKGRYIIKKQKIDQKISKEEKRQVDAFPRLKKVLFEEFICKKTTIKKKYNLLG